MLIFFQHEDCSKSKLIRDFMSEQSIDAVVVSIAWWDEPKWDYLEKHSEGVRQVPFLMDTKYAKDVNGYEAIVEHLKQCYVKKP